MLVIQSTEGLVAGATYPQNRTSLYDHYLTDMMKTPRGQVMTLNDTWKGSLSFSFSLPNSLSPSLSFGLSPPLSVQYLPLVLSLHLSLPPSIPSFSLSLSLYI